MDINNRMAKASSRSFYSNLDPIQSPIGDVLVHPEWFHEVPEDWAVVLTDIKGSTKAVAAGNHQIVNLIATGSIIAVLNIAHAHKIEIPFFFGGDGATMVVPADILGICLESLYEYRERTLEKFAVDLRVGHVSVAALKAANEPLTLCKVLVSEILNIPVVLGRSLQFAEGLIKGQAVQASSTDEDEIALDLTGMECRWSSISPPESKTEVVSLLVSVQSSHSQADVYKRVFDIIDRIYGTQAARTPISVAKLKLDNTVEKIRTEMRLKLNAESRLYLWMNWFITLMGHIWFRFFSSGKTYLNSLVQLSDTLVIDGRINTVISGTASQRVELSEALSELEHQGLLIFGLHASERSVMSCYVRDRKDQHIHFVDGSGGGYTKAATMLKAKFGKP